MKKIQLIVVQLMLILSVGAMQPPPSPQRPFWPPKGDFLPSLRTPAGPMGLFGQAHPGAFIKEAAIPLGGGQFRTINLDIKKHMTAGPTLEEYLLMKNSEGLCPLIALWYDTNNRLHFDIASHVNQRLFGTSSPDQLPDEQTLQTIKRYEGNIASVASPIYYFYLLALPYTLYEREYTIYEREFQLLGSDFELMHGAPEKKEFIRTFFQANESLDPAQRAESQISLVRIFLDKGDLKLAKKFATLAANQKANNDAQVKAWGYLANIAKRERSPDQILHWNTLVANQKHNLKEQAAANYNLGRIYQYGSGVEKDLEKAQNYFKKAAEQNADPNIKQKAEKELADLMPVSIPMPAYAPAQVVKPTPMEYEFFAVPFDEQMEG